jgi:putative ABC transport system permease protein
MAAVAAREIATRPERKFRGLAGLGLSAGAVAIATAVTAGVALTTAIRPHPWYDPRYAVALVGIILGSVLNAGSLSLDSLLSAVGRERAAIEAQLALGAGFHTAAAPLLREAVRRGLLPTVNQMSAAGVITLPGIMTGQILAGLDPLEAVKYQILLMFLLAGASGLAALAIAYAAIRRLTDDRQRLRLDRLA